MKAGIHVASIISIVLFVAGCKSFNSDDGIYKANYTDKPITIDGKLDEAAWANAKDLNFKPLPRYACTESGTAKVLWDDKYVYFSGVFHDSDIVQEGTEDWGHHYKTGDVMEVFLKPGNQRYYWEMYATPNNKKTAFFFLSKGRLGLPSGFDYKVPGMIVASTCKGTLNNAGDRDVLWTAEMAVPRKELEKRGEKITPGKVWTFLMARYNYSVYLDGKELSMSGIPTTNSFHDFDSWRRLMFVKK